MQGRNTLILNTATMLEIVQAWIDESGVVDGTKAIGIVSSDRGLFTVELDTPAPEVLK